MFPLSLSGNAEIIGCCISLVRVTIFILLRFLYLTLLVIVVFTLDAIASNVVVDNDENVTLCIGCSVGGCEHTAF